MGEHHILRKLGDVPGHRTVEIVPPKFVHVSKELHMEPIMEPRLDVNGKRTMKTVGFKFVLYRGDGVTFRRTHPRLHWRDKTRVRSKKSLGIPPGKNNWGSEPYMAQRDRQEAARASRTG